MCSRKLVLHKRWPVYGCGKDEVQASTGLLLIQVSISDLSNCKDGGLVQLQGRQCFWHVM